MLRLRLPGNIHIDVSETVNLGRGNPSCLTDPFFSRQHLSFTSQGPQALSLEVVGSNAAVVEEEDESTPGVWRPVAFLEKGEKMQLRACHRLFIASRKDTTMISIVASAVAASALPLPPSRLIPSSSQQQPQPSPDSGHHRQQEQQQQQQQQQRSPQADQPQQRLLPKDTSLPQPQPGKPQRQERDAPFSGLDVSLRLQPLGAPVSDLSSIEGAPASKRQRVEDALLVGPVAQHSVSSQLASSLQAQASGSRPCMVDVDSSIPVRPGIGPCPVSLLWVSGLPERHNSGCLGARLRDLVVGDISTAWVSNYMIDMDFLAEECPALFQAGKLIVCHGMADRGAKTAMLEIAQAEGASGVTVHMPPLPIAFGTHHSKAFILSYATGLRVIIHTANLIVNDNTTKSQSLWYQDFPPKSSAARESGVQSDFERELHQYLYALTMPYEDQKRMLDLVKGHDFSFARAGLLTSVPGYHLADKMHRYGHLRVRALLAQQKLPPISQECSLVAQFSSIGSIDEKWLLEEWGPSFAAGSQPSKAKIQPAHLSFVWPTCEEIRESFEGWGAGGSVCGSGENIGKPFLAKYWRRFGGEPHGRHRAAPHIKSYLRHHGQQILWYILTSSNMSKAAWGALQKKGTQLMVRSYEMGVLLLPTLESAYRASDQAGFCCTPHQAPLIHSLPVTLPLSSTTTTTTHKPSGNSNLEKPIDLRGPGTSGWEVHSSKPALLDADVKFEVAIPSAAIDQATTSTFPSGQAPTIKPDNPLSTTAKPDDVPSLANIASGEQRLAAPVLQFYSLASRSVQGGQGNGLSSNPTMADASSSKIQTSSVEVEQHCYLPIPYLLPPVPYQAGDQAWGWHLKPTGPDALGKFLERG